MLEQLIVTYCAPTLAAVTTGNLFSCRCEEMDDLRGQLDRCSRCVNSKGVLLRLRGRCLNSSVYVPGCTVSGFCRGRRYGS